jgi:hypothetical protein
MPSVTLVGVSILVMAVASYRCRKTIMAMKNVAKLKSGNLLYVLVLFFLLGYISYFIFLLYSHNGEDRHHILIAIIFFFGAVFVNLIFRVNLKLIRQVEDSEKKKTKVIDDLREEHQDLVKHKEELEKIKKDLKEKNKELEATMEDFYTMRLPVSEQVKRGKFEKENEKIRKKIDDFKNN